MAYTVPPMPLTEDLLWLNAIADAGWPERSEMPLPTGDYPTYEDAPQDRAPVHWSVRVRRGLVGRTEGAIIDGDDWAGFTTNEYIQARSEQLGFAPSRFTWEPIARRRNRRLGPVPLNSEPPAWLIAVYHSAELAAVWDRVLGNGSD
jgi:hypothetical protein